jgi:hypothetical protein
MRKAHKAHYKVQLKLGICSLHQEKQMALPGSILFFLSTLRWGLWQL